MPMTERQRARRIETANQRLGCSDIPALMGADKYRNAADLWYRATGRIVPKDEPNEAMILGTALEGPLLDWAQDRLGKLVRNQFRVHSTGMLAAHLDAIVVATGEPVQAKTHGFAAGPGDEWGEPETDAVPDHVYWQVQGEMLIAAAGVDHVPSWQGIRGRKMYHVPAVTELQSAILERLAWFFGLVERDTPPERTPPALDTLKAIRRQPNKVISLPADIAAAVERRDYLKGIAKRIDEHVKGFDRTIIDALGDAEAGVIEGLGTVEYAQRTRKAYQVAETTYRELRIKPGKFLELTEGAMA